jgi:hypothetical protein
MIPLGIRLKPANKVNRAGHFQRKTAFQPVNRPGRSLNQSKIRALVTFSAAC